MTRTSKIQWLSVAPPCDKGFVPTFNAKFKCLRCRASRVPCDKLLPSCTRCSTLGLECVQHQKPSRRTTTNTSNHKRAFSPVPSSDDDDSVATTITTTAPSTTTTTAHKRPRVVDDVDVHTHGNEPSPSLTTTTTTTKASYSPFESKHHQHHVAIPIVPELTSSPVLTVVPQPTLCHTTQVKKSTSLRDQLDQICDLVESNMELLNRIPTSPSTSFYLPDTLKHEEEDEEEEEEEEQQQRQQEKDEEVPPAVALMMLGSSIADQVGLLLDLLDEGMALPDDGDDNRPIFM